MEGLDLLLKEDDVAYEEELVRSPYALRTWLDYIASKKGSPAKARYQLFERALKNLPGSYKIWRAYLSERVAQTTSGNTFDPKVQALNSVFERALVFMHKMPTIWIEYLRFLLPQRRLTSTRRTFDRALQSLPVTQHDKIWPIYVQFAKESGVVETCIRIYRRYLMFSPAGREEYVDFLLATGNADEAAFQLAAMVNDDKFVSQRGRSKHALWMQLCDIVSKHPGEVTSLRVDPVLRSGINRFTDEVGRLWCSLAEFYVRQGAFDKARDVYEEAIAEVVTVRDFATVYDAYVQFEEAMLLAKMQMSSAAVSAPASDATVGNASSRWEVQNAEDLDDVSCLQGDAASGVGAAGDVDLRVARLELLIERRAILLSGVLLRQNPHNVTEWLKRMTLLTEGGHTPAKVVTCFTEAVHTVDPWQAVGKLSALWIAFARYYEGHGDLTNARAVFSRASEADFRSADDLAAVWCEWAELEMRVGAYAEALSLMQRATTEPAGRKARADALPGTGDAAPSRASKRSSVRHKLHRNLRAWGLYLDLEESLGTPTSTKAAYDRAISLKVATPLMVLNYANYLEERSFFEDAFRAYERGIAVFPWPHVKELWVAYLTKFVERYGGSKLERARDLFEQAVDGCPAEESLTLYRMYAAMEERHGSLRHAMAVYDRATRATDDAHRYEVFLAYIRKAEEFFGPLRTREIYERAVDELPENQVKDMCLRFAAMEAMHGEAERARALYVHASTYCDPRAATVFWKTWQDFEVEHGNEETFREMLRIKRSVATSFSSANYAVEDLLVQAAGGTPASAAPASTGAAPVTLDDLEVAKPPMAGSKRSAAQAQLPSIRPVPISGHDSATTDSSGAAPVSTNPDEIDLDFDNSGADDIEQKQVPTAVFGGLTADGPARSQAGDTATKGALDRFRSRQR